MSSSSVSIMTSLQAHSPKMEKQQRGKLKNEALVKVGKRAPTFLGLGPFTQYDSDSWFVHVRGLLLSKYVKMQNIAHQPWLLLEQYECSRQSRRRHGLSCSDLER